MRFLIVLAFLLAGCSQPEPFKPTPRFAKDIRSLERCYSLFDTDDVLIVYPGEKEGQAVVVFDRRWSELNERARHWRATSVFEKWQEIHGENASIIVMTDMNEVILDAS